VSHCSTVDGPLKLRHDGIAPRLYSSSSSSGGDAVLQAILTFSLPDATKFWTKAGYSDDTAADMASLCKEAKEGSPPSSSRIYVSDLSKVCPDHRPYVQQQPNPARACDSLIPLASCSPAGQDDHLQAEQRCERGCSGAARELQAVA
jgi:hypothetical protein